MKSSSNSSQKKANILTLAPRSREGRRVAQTLAALISHAAAQVATNPTLSVVNHLSLVLGLSSSDQINLQELIKIEKSGDAIQATVLRPGLTLWDFLAPRSKDKVTSTRLAEMLYRTSISVPISAFRDALAPWKNANPFGKHLLLCLAAEFGDVGCGFFSVRINDAKGRRILAGQSQGKSLGDSLRNELAGLSKFGPASLCLEVTADAKKEPHFHGLILGYTETVDDDVVAEALSKLVGFKTYTKPAHNSIHVQQTYFSPGAVLYMFQQLGGSGFPEDLTATYLSNDAATIAKTYREVMASAIADVLGEPNWLKGRPTRDSIRPVEAFDLEDGFECLPPPAAKDSLPAPPSQSLKAASEVDDGASDLEEFYGLLDHGDRVSNPHPETPPTPTPVVVSQPELTSATQTECKDEEWEKLLAELLAYTPEDARSEDPQLERHSDPAQPRSKTWNPPPWEDEGPDPEVQMLMKLYDLA